MPGLKLQLNLNKVFLKTIPLSLWFVGAISAQRSDYWQIETNYDMHVRLDDAKHQLAGQQKLTLTNHSPDTLFALYYHLYFNAFQPNSAMDFRSRWLPDPDRRVGNRIAALTEDQIGFQKVTSIQLNGQSIPFKVVGTILEVSLPTPILPGQSAVIDMVFQSQVPIQIRRSGRNSADGIDYSMTQWYPKLSAYDAQGWHADPYIGREFYGNFGRFEVTLDLPAKYVVGATGVLQNPQEIGMGYGSKSPNFVPKEKGRQVWKFKAEKVHDFAWAADPDYQHDQLEVPGGPVIHFLYQPQNNLENWKKLQTYMVPFFQNMAQYFGHYPYPVFSFIEGGDGGMEYPMATLITSRGALDGLVSVAFHEAIHNWFYGILATHEGKYPWMDEGFTHFATELMMDLVFKGNDGKDAQKGNYQAYFALLKRDQRQPLSTHADWYNRNSDYSLSAYVAGAVYLNQLRYVVGEEAWRSGLLRYFEVWKFKHPDPWDFLRIMERTSQLELDWYHEQFVYSLQTIDYRVTASEEKGKATIVLERKGGFPMPIDLMVRLKSGKKLAYYIPLELMRGGKKEKIQGEETTVLPAWEWVFTSYRIPLAFGLDQVADIEIDPSRHMADIDPQDNLWKAEEKAKTKP